MAKLTGVVPIPNTSLEAALLASDLSFAAVRGQLERILQSEPFARAPQLRRLLRYVVEAAFHGKQDSLKEYLLGVDVFDRGEDFDPKQDPIVRTDARRLRSRLRDYYASAGANDPIEIRLAKVGYAPVFERRTLAAPTADHTATRLLIQPFEPATPDDDLFAAGLTEEITFAASRIPGLRIVGRSAARTAAAHRPSEVGAPTHTLAGSVRRQGDLLRVNATLCQGAEQLWTSRYEVSLAEGAQIFALQDRLALQIAGRLHLETPPPPTLRGTPSLPAYQYCVNARRCLESLNPALFMRAVPLLEAAIKLDPAFAPAHAWLAQAHLALATHWAGPLRDCLAAASRYAERSLELDPELANGHAQRGVIAMAADYDIRAAARHFDQALSLDPLSPDVRTLRAFFLLLPARRFAEAEAEFRDLLDADPLSPPHRLGLARTFQFSGRPHLAAAEAQRVLDIHPGLLSARFQLAFAYDAMGRAEDARPLHRQILSNTIFAAAPILLQALEALWAGRREEAFQIAGRMKDHPGSIFSADFYLQAGEHGFSLDWIEKLVDERAFLVPYLGIDPRFDPLRAHPRFIALLARLGL